MLALVGSNPVLRQQESPTLAAADRVVRRLRRDTSRPADANDVLYALEASWDYDPAPALEPNHRARSLAVNFADDLVNPPELGILEREIARVPKGRAVVMPFSRADARPRQPHHRGALEHLLAELLAASGAGP